MQDRMIAATGIPSRQFLACALRYGEVAKVLLPYRLIGERMGVTPMAAYKLVRKGTARLRAIGCDVNNLTSQSRPCAA